MKSFKKLTIALLAVTATLSLAAAAGGCNFFGGGKDSSGNAQNSSSSSVSSSSASSSDVSSSDMPEESSYSSNSVSSSASSSSSTSSETSVDSSSSSSETSVDSSSSSSETSIDSSSASTSESSSVNQSSESSSVNQSSDSSVGGSVDSSVGGSVDSSAEPPLDSSANGYITPIWNDWVCIDEPSCTEEGLKKRTKIADGTEETASIAARGHEYSEETALCIRCSQAAVIPELIDPEFPLVDLCTHTDEAIYEGLCDCTYKGRGEEYSRVELTEGCYLLEIPSTQELWLSFSVQEAGQYVLYSVDSEVSVSVTRHAANFGYVNPNGTDAIKVDKDFYSYANDCREGYYNSEWRATYRLRAVVGTMVKVCFTKVDGPAWEPKSVRTKVYPQQINGVKASEGKEGEALVEVPYNADYFYSDPAEGGDGYYHLGTKQNPGKIIYAAIDHTASRLLGSDKFTTVLNNIGTALNLSNGFTADGDNNILVYVPFIMNWLDEDAAAMDNPKVNPNRNCYQNFCNKDGLYPVNQELFKFLNLYVRSNKPADSNVTNEDWLAEKNKSLASTDNELWLSACYYYASLEKGTEDTPLEIAPDVDTEINVKAYENFYCTLEGNGIYTIKGGENTPDSLYIGIGENFFKLKDGIVVSAPADFYIFDENAQAVTVTIKATLTEGTNNGQGNDVATPIVITQTEITLSPIAIYNADGTVSYYAYYAYTPTVAGTLTLTLSEETDAYITLGGQVVAEDATSVSVTVVDTDTPLSGEIKLGEPVIIYISAEQATEVTVTLA